MTLRLFPEDGDLLTLAEIHRACFFQAWTADALGKLLATPGSFAFYMDCGFVLARVAASEAEILTLAVLPDRRRAGVGAALVRIVADHAQSFGADQILLEVAAVNAAARALYAGLGFVQVGQRAAYYASGAGKGEDALILRSNLPLAPLGKRPGAG